MSQNAPTGRCCLTCHFLTDSHRCPDGFEASHPLGREDRERLARGEPLPGCGDQSLACFRDVWRVSNPPAEWVAQLGKTLRWERGETCFHYPHTPGMLFPAAVELERRAAERRALAAGSANASGRAAAPWPVVIGLIGMVLGTILGLVLARLLGSAM
jgi:hypothetical protein